MPTSIRRRIAECAAITWFGACILFTVAFLVVAIKVHDKQLLQGMMRLYSQASEKGTRSAIASFVPTFQQRIDIRN
jgi:hypothetical protein